MFDLGTGEIFVIAVVALLVVGPKHIPDVLRTVSRGMKQLRGMAREFQKGMDELSKEAGLEDVRRDMNDLNRIRNPRAWVGDALEGLDDEDDEDDAALLAKPAPAPRTAAAATPALDKPAADVPVALATAAPSGPAGGPAVDLAKGAAAASPTPPPAQAVAR